MIERNEILSVDLRGLFPRVYHGFGGRKRGIEKADYDCLLNGEKNFDTREYLDLSDWPFRGLLFSKQVHGNRIFLYRPEDSESLAQPDSFGFEADGLVTSERGIGLAVLTADCLPVLLFAYGKGVVGAVHAGWRGTLEGVVIEGLKVMRETFGVKPGEVVALLGPCIGTCCFDVGDELVATCPENLSCREGRWFFDLAGLNRSQLISAGCAEENIFSVNVCTKCRGDIFYSYRREGEEAGRMISFIGLIL